MQDQDGSVLIDLYMYVDLWNVKFVSRFLQYVLVKLKF